MKFSQALVLPLFVAKLLHAQSTVILVVANNSLTVDAQGDLVGEEEKELFNGIICARA